MGVLDPALEMDAAYSLPPGRSFGCRDWLGVHKGQHMGRWAVSLLQLRVELQMPVEVSVKWPAGGSGDVFGKTSFQGLWTRPFVTFGAGWSFHGPAVSLGSVHAFKKDLAWKARYAP